MKKVLLSIVLGITGLTAYAQTATNFNCNDCAGNNHDLFSELDAGKVIVIAWVMPCGTCLGPSLTASNIVQSYASSNPNTVFMYVADDNANTTCSSLNSWVNSNGIVANAVFSNTALDMSDYGTPGMPKIIVLGGGSAHAVFFNQNGTAAGNSTALQNAIDAALATGVNDFSTSMLAVNLFPNPASEISTLEISTEVTTEVTITINNQLGQSVMNVYSGTLTPGENRIQFSVADLADGIYQIQVSGEKSNQVIKLVVSH